MHALRRQNAAVWAALAARPEAGWAAEVFPLGQPPRPANLGALPGQVGL
jgi:hypothetical protein